MRTFGCVGPASIAAQLGRRKIRWLCYKVAGRPSPQSVPRLQPASLWGRYFLEFSALTSGSLLRLEGPPARRDAHLVQLGVCFPRPTGPRAAPPRGVPTRALVAPGPVPLNSGQPRYGRTRGRDSSWPVLGLSPRGDPSPALGLLSPCCFRPRLSRCFPCGLASRGVAPP